MAVIDSHRERENLCNSTPNIGGGGCFAAENLVHKIPQQRDVNRNFLKIYSRVRDGNVERRCENFQKQTNHTLPRNASARNSTP